MGLPSTSAINRAVFNQFRVTGSQNADRFPSHFSVNPSRVNGLSQKSVLLVSQLRAIDNLRIKKKIGVFIMFQFQMDRI
ncbi:MAG: type II toxin-antitoxin system PemK/MazF family toxin [Desulfomonilaceae bacterium]